MHGDNGAANYITEPAIFLRNKFNSSLSKVVQRLPGNQVNLKEQTARH